jgi:GT2 family glycosyltransferase
MISIIIPAYNQHEMTFDCMRSVRRKSENYEIILIDNGSNPKYEHQNFLRPVIIRNEENLGFPKAVNQGIRVAHGETIILLNNDVIVTPEWAERLARWIGVYAILAPMTNYCAGLQRATLPVYHDENELDTRAQEWSEANSGKIIPVNWVIGFCMAFRKSLWEEIGPFDESLWPCSGEEIDFCLRARKAGHSVSIAHDVYVHHFGSQTFADMQRAGQADYNQIVERNNRHLAEKWGEKWIQQAV